MTDPTPDLTGALTRRIVTAFRQWVDQHGAPTWAPGATPPPPLPLSKAVLLDRYEQHTKHCPTCTQVPSLCSLCQGLSAQLVFDNCCLK